MSNPNYLRSTDGNDADNGSTWALANATIVGSVTDSAAGDTTWLSQVHSESTAGAVTFSSPGTQATPSKYLCGNDAAEPPTALATTAVVATSGASVINLNGSYYMYGVTINCGSGSGSGLLITFFADNTQDTQTYESCAFNLLTTGASSRIYVGNGGNVAYGDLRWKNCSCSFAATSQGIAVHGPLFIWEGGSITGTPPTALFIPPNGGRQASAIISGVDLSSLGSGNYLVNVAAYGSGIIKFIDCKLAAGVAVKTGTWAAPGAEIWLQNCDSADTNYLFAKSCFAGDVTTETVIVKTSPAGSSDGTTAYSFKMVSSADARYPIIPLTMDIPAVWNNTVGSAVTLTVEIVHDTNVVGGQGAGTAFAFQDDEIYLGVEYLGNGSFPISSFINDAPATIITAAADQASSSVTWTTTGLTTPVKQKLSVTFTPQEKGYFLPKVYLCKASKTVYVDGDAVIT